MNAKSGLAILIACVAAEDRAEACGGFFCSGPATPVVQTKEGIIFAVDHDANEVTAIINIAYEGTAADFAWLLPLVTEPTHIELAPRNVFFVADSLTSPMMQFSSITADGTCAPVDYDANVQYWGAVPHGTANGVELLGEAAVGPYDTVVLRATRPEPVQAWLVANGYTITGEMLATVLPYIAQGNVLLALKLRKGADIGEIQPISLTLPETTEACIPLRMTAIAALEDMDITAFVLSNRGRAIPENYFHVTLNWAKMNWLTFGANYRQVVAQAMDEAGGNAFTTEYAGPANIFADRIYRDGIYDIPALRAETRLKDFLSRVQLQGWQSSPDAREVLMKHIPELAACAGGCPVETFEDRDFDPNPLLDELEVRVIEPERKTQALFDRHAYLTRLYTLISPEEMNVDPLFDYDATLPDVSNVHSAQRVEHCGDGGYAGSAGTSIILEDGTRIDFAGRRSLLDSMPSAARIEQLSTKTVVEDNYVEIARAIEEHNKLAGGDGCACGSTKRDTAGALLMFGLVLFALRSRAAAAARRR